MLNLEINLTGAEFTTTESSNLQVKWGRPTHGSLLPHPTLPDCSFLMSYYYLRTDKSLHVCVHVCVYIHIVCAYMCAKAHIVHVEVKDKYFVFLLHIVIICVYMSMCVCPCLCVHVSMCVSVVCVCYMIGSHTIVHMWESEDTVMKLVFLPPLRGF